MAFHPQESGQAESLSVSSPAVPGAWCWRGRGAVLNVPLIDAALNSLFI